MRSDETASIPTPRKYCIELSVGFFALDGRERVVMRTPAETRATEVSLKVRPADEKETLEKLTI